MVLSHIADKLGLWDVIAPGPSREQITERRKQEEKDRQLANQMQKEEDQRHRRLTAQYESEKNAEKLNQFAKKQRVSYYSKIDDRLIDAVIVGVHLDDGPDKPYYTIKYKKLEQRIESDGSEKVVEIDMEKQTNADRLTRLPWDEEKSWKIIK
mmetsp:Transcript_6415/g.7963  ORF Transcript_6415/g.7963 Transcript_6415/m.7963 type:complete len:153 (+) Transcript_6415:86-544(+)